MQVERWADTCQDNRLTGFPGKENHAAARSELEALDLRFKAELRDEPKLLKHAARALILRPAVLEHPLSCWILLA